MVLTFNLKVKLTLKPLFLKDERPKMLGTSYIETKYDIRVNPLVVDEQEHPSRKANYFLTKM